MSEKMIECDICGKDVVLTNADHCSHCGNTYCLDCESGSVNLCWRCEEEEDVW